MSVGSFGSVGCRHAPRMVTRVLTHGCERWLSVVEGDDIDADGHVREVGCGRMARHRRATEARLPSSARKTL